MTPQNDFDRALSAWLHERAQPYAPDHLREVAPERAVRVRPRPVWRIPERWIPMPVTLRLALVPRAVILLMLLALATALATASMVVGSRLHLFATVPLPPPVGPAANGLIAYGVAGDIWVVNPDGTDARPLITGPAFDAGPLWSRDGTRLAYWSSESESHPVMSLVVGKADGSSPVTVATHQRSENPGGTDWSPDGTRLAYHVCGPTPPCSERIVVTKADGTGSGPVGDPSFPAWNPSWSPTGSQIAFGGGQVVDKGVYVMGSDGSDPRRISDIADATPNSFIHVQWSPMGDRILSQADPNGTPHRIWSFAADGSDEWNVPGTPSDSRLARWSPEGKLISFYIVEGGERWLSVIPAEGGEPTRLRSDIELEWSWSPDGTSFVGRRCEPSAALCATERGLAVLDATTGETLWELDDIVLDGFSWQRVAPDIAVP